MLEITLKQGLILRKALAALTEIAEEATFKYSSEGIELIALNTDSILMGVLKFRSLDFQLFVCDTEGIGCFDLDLLYETLLKHLVFYGHQGTHLFGIFHSISV
jgi:hypothetical protein